MRADAGGTVVPSDRDIREAPAQLCGDAAIALYEWMRVRDYRGFDLHDILASRAVTRLTFGSRWLAVAWTQAGKRLPTRTRALMGVRPQQNAKGIGLALAAAVRLSVATGSPRWSSEAAAHRHWLVEHAVRDGDCAGWGYPFPWANRDFFAPAGVPSGVATAFIGHALLDAATAFGDDASAALACDAARFLQRRLRRVPMDGAFAFSYTPLDTRVVHNANVLAASLLARVGERTGDETMLSDARTAAGASARAQAADGSWPYGAGRRNAWIDSMHTSYVLVGLDQVRIATGATELDDAIAHGVSFWRKAFFHSPAVGFSPGRPFPVDLHAVAHSIVALRALADRIRGARQEAERLACWCLAEMRDEDGSFYYRMRAPGVIDRTRYMRWTQAWMLLALAEVAAWS
jgi:hypothetical protein